jgi:ArsR family transcriptional regulator, cadmium/lead-responsive transcriptional repressor
MSATETAPFRLPAQPSPADIVAKYFRAFGDATRIRIMEALAEGELSVGEIVDRVGASQTGVSNHLACLRWCGFVETRREHRTIYYRLADERVPAMLELAQSLLADNAEHVAACRRIDEGP